ncbi:hypothetical protein BDR26DRAFT_915257 [Obelidium mucronatum]|nr:hypothetical protein BDR26DRAFT_915257 [Obelidium mucronatum]
MILTFPILLLLHPLLVHSESYQPKTPQNQFIGCYQTALVEKTTDGIVECFEQCTQKGKPVVGARWDDDLETVRCTCGGIISDFRKLAFSCDQECPDETETDWTCGKENNSYAFSVYSLTPITIISAGQIPNSSPRTVQTTAKPGTNVNSESGISANQSGQNNSSNPTVNPPTSASINPVDSGSSANNIKIPIIIVGAGLTAAFLGALGFFVYRAHSQKRLMIITAAPAENRKTLMQRMSMRAVDNQSFTPPLYALPDDAPASTLCRFNEDVEALYFDTLSHVDSSRSVLDEQEC